MIFYSFDLKVEVNYSKVGVSEPPGAQIKDDVVKSMLYHGRGWRREWDLGSEKVLILKILLFIQFFAF